MLRALVKKELREVSDRLGTPRRTLLLASTGTPMGAAAADDAALAALPSVSRSGKGLELQIPDDPCVVVLSASGALDVYKRQGLTGPVRRSGAGSDE